MIGHIITLMDIMSQSYAVHLVIPMIEAVLLPPLNKLTSMRMAKVNRFVNCFRI